MMMMLGNETTFTATSHVYMVLELLLAAAQPHSAPERTSPALHSMCITFHSRFRFISLAYALQIYIQSGPLSQLVCVCVFVCNIFLACIAHARLAHGVRRRRRDTVETTDNLQLPTCTGKHAGRKTSQHNMICRPFCWHAAYTSAIKRSIRTLTHRHSSL